MWQTLQRLRFDGAIELLRFCLPLGGMIELNDSAASGKTAVRSVTSSRHMSWEMCLTMQSLTPTWTVIALTLCLTGKEWTHALGSRVAMPGTHTLYIDWQRGPSRPGLIYLVTKSPIRRSEVVCGMEMLFNISFGEDLCVVSFCLSCGLPGFSYNWWVFQAWYTLQDSTDNNSIDKAETSLNWQECFSQLQDTTDALPCHIHLPVCLWVMVCKLAS